MRSRQKPFNRRAAVATIVHARQHHARMRSRRLPAQRHPAEPEDESGHA